MERLRLLLVLAILAALLAGCGQPEKGDDPVTATKEWMLALLNMDGNKIAERTCKAERGVLRNEMLWGTGLSALAHVLTGAKVEGDISDLEFELVTRLDEDAVVVTIVGTARVAAGGIWEETTLHQARVVRKEGGKWRVCEKAPEWMPLPPAAECFQTPEAMIRAYFDALNAMDTERAVACFNENDAREHYELIARSVEYMNWNPCKKGGIRHRYEIVSIDLVEDYGDKKAYNVVYDDYDNCYEDSPFRTSVPYPMWVINVDGCWYLLLVFYKE